MALLIKLLLLILVQDHMFNLKIFLSISHHLLLVWVLLNGQKSRILLFKNSLDLDCMRPKPILEKDPNSIWLPSIKQEASLSIIKFQVLIHMLQSTSNKIKVPVIHLRVNIKLGLKCLSILKEITKSWLQGAISMFLGQAPILHPTNNNKQAFRLFSDMKLDSRWAQKVQKAYQQQMPTNEMQKMLFCKNLLLTSLGLQRDLKVTTQEISQDQGRTPQKRLLELSLRVRRYRSDYHRLKQQIC
jgi:hypothetical protein